MTALDQVKEIAGYDKRFYADYNPLTKSWRCNMTYKWMQSYGFLENLFLARIPKMNGVTQLRVAKIKKRNIQTYDFRD